MVKYIFHHDIPSESDRMDQMADVLDGVSRNHLRRIPIQKHWKCLEVGAGNGSLSKWLSPNLPEGNIRVTDINPDLIADVTGPNLTVHGLNVVEDDLGEEIYDLVFLRAVLHHIAEREAVLTKLIRSLKPGGWIFIHEPDMHPSRAAPDEAVRVFWSQFFSWASSLGIDYTTGTQIPQMLTERGMTNMSAWGDTAVYPGGSEYALWLQLTIAEIADKMLASENATRESLDRFNQASEDPDRWHMSVSFVGTIAMKQSA
ncbi:MAG: class I SAM-dependent methyltransferase [Pseudomonadota bacterium]